MIFLKWYMIVFVYSPIVLYVLTLLQMVATTKKLKRIHKDYKPEKNSFAETLSTMLYLLFLMFIPILNIGAYSFSFSHEDEIIKRLYDKYLERKELDENNEK